MASNTGRTGRTWRRTRAAVLATSNVCHICGQPIDMRLSGQHPDGPTVDHVRALARGGHPTALSNLRPAHRRCNVSKQAGAAPPPATTREW